MLWPPAVPPFRLLELHAVCPLHVESLNETLLLAVGLLRAGPCADLLELRAGDFWADVTPWLPLRHPELRIEPGSVPPLLVAC